uniref:Uncharacterized protein n=1 Tax=Glossina pallidipes TaxID=7398 RepID=A0A1B0ABV7_GLOPL
MEETVAYMLHTSLGAENAVAAELVVFADEVAILCCNMHGELIYDTIITVRFCDQLNMLGNTSTSDIKHVYQLKFFVRELGSYVDDTVIRQEILVRAVQYALREDKD